MLPKHDIWKQSRFIPGRPTAERMFILQQWAIANVYLKLHSTWWIQKHSDTHFLMFWFPGQDCKIHEYPTYWHPEQCYHKGERPDSFKIPSRVWQDELIAPVSFWHQCRNYNALSLVGPSTTWRVCSKTWIMHKLWCFTAGRNSTGGSEQHYAYR